MKNYKTIILANQEIAPGYCRMRILAPGFGAQVRPGQFIMLRMQTPLPLLRRPFGVFRTGQLPPDCEGEPPREYLETLYKVVGSGTAALRELHAGDRVEVLGPLGKGFDPGDPSQEKVLVGGGIGLVPLYLLAEELIRRGERVRLLMGGRTRDDILAVTEFERLGVETYVATDDGSLGEQGFVTQVLLRKLDRYPQAEVFACGPMPMLEAVYAICAARGVPLQVSLEAMMACGVGACLGCVVKGAGHSEETPRYLCTCKEGPVFRAEQLDWSRLGLEEGYCEGCKS
jgi:dihydroorotate dehydrogenase electron transfer subunit